MADKTNIQQRLMDKGLPKIKAMIQEHKIPVQFLRPMFAIYIDGAIDGAEETKDAIVDGIMEDLTKVPELHE